MKRLSCLLLLLTATTGCESLMHELQPHRLWRLNYQDPAGRTDGTLFSVSDPIKTETPDNLSFAPDKE